MGFFSADENEVIKTSDTTGNINNNLVLSNAAETYVEILLLIIAIIKVVEFLYIVYTNYIRRLKRRFGGTNGQEMV